MWHWGQRSVRILTVDPSILTSHFKARVKSKWNKKPWTDEVLWSMFAVNPDEDNQVKEDGAVMLPTRAVDASINGTRQTPAGAADLHPCRGSNALVNGINVRLDTLSNGYNAIVPCQVGLFCCIFTVQCVVILPLLLFVKVLGRQCRDGRERAPPLWWSVGNRSGLVDCTLLNFHKRGFYFAKHCHGKAAAVLEVEFRQVDVLVAS